MSATRKRNLKRAGLATIIAVIAALLIVAIAGGGGKKPLVARTPKTPTATTPTTSTSTSPASADRPVLNAAEYRKRVDALCAAVPTNAGSSTGGSLEQAGAGLASGAQLDQRLHDQIAALTPPPALTGKANSALSVFQQEITPLQQVAVAAENNDTTNGRALYEQAAGLAPQVDAAWHAVGVTQCG